MARQVISTTPHLSGLGNKAFESFEKVNDNFLELYTGANIPALPAASALTGMELFPAVQGGVLVKVLASLIAAGAVGDARAATYAAARLLSGAATGDRLQVLGRTAQSDGGQGLFTWVAGGSTILNDGYQLSAPGGIWQRTPDQLTTPFMFGAKGDGAAGGGTNDTTAVLAAVNTGFCFLPPNCGFKVTSPVKPPRGGTLVGASVHSSALVGSGVSGGIVEVGDGGVTTINEVKIGNFRVYGTATYAVKMDHASIITADTIYAGAGSLDVGVTTAYTHAFWFDYVFDSKLDNLSVFGLTLGGTATFTGSVGGAASGTLTVAIPNGKHPMIFNNGDQRVVTITGGTAATWPVALIAGTVTTARYGCAFFAGGAFNTNVCHNWQTSSGAAYSGYFEDINSVGTSIGNTFDGMTLQASNVGLYVGNGWAGAAFNGIYTESVGQNIVLGSKVNNKTCDSLTFNAPILAAVTAAAGGFANPSNAVLRLDFCSSIVFNSPQILCYQYAQKAPVTITRGGGDTTGGGAAGLCLVTPAGVIKAITLYRPGSGYTAAPTVAIGGLGSGATATATFGNVCTFAGTTTSNILTVTSVASGSLAIGNTLTGGGVPTGTYLGAPINVGPLGVGTWLITNAGSWTPTGASAISALNLTASGSGYAAGYAAVSVGDVARCTIIAPKCQFDGTDVPLWPLVVDSSTDHRDTGGGLEIISDFDHSYPDGTGLAIPVSMKRMYAGQGANQVYSVAYEGGMGAIAYVKYTAPNYP